MRYLGGKSRIAKALAEVIDRYRQPGQLVWDAFCGGLSMSVALSKKGPVWSTDACVPLISLYRAVQNGWAPPTEVSLDQYKAAKSLPDTDPLKAFCGFCCSFSGKWFGGYEKPLRLAHVKNGKNAGRVIRVRQSAVNARKMQTDVSACQRFDAIDFLAIEPQPTTALLYLDPPYAGTTGFSAVPPFDHARFVERVRGWALHTHVFVSEYAFPIGDCLAALLPKSRGNRPVLQMAKEGSIERLYHLHL